MDQLSPLSCSMPSTNIYRALTTYQACLHLTGDKHINIRPPGNSQVLRGQTQQNRGTGYSGDRVYLYSSCGQEWSLNGETPEARPELGRAGHVALWDKAFLVEEARRQEQVWSIWNKARPVWLGLRELPPGQLAGCSEMPIRPRPSPARALQWLLAVLEVPCLEVTLCGSFPHCSPVTLVARLSPPPGLCPCRSLCLGQLPSHSSEWPL